MFIERNGQKFTLTEDELRQAHSEYDHRLLLEDAQTQLEEYIGDYFEGKSGEQAFLTKYGYGHTMLFDPESEHYLLERMVEEFSHLQDENVPNHSAWLEAIIFSLRGGTAAERELAANNTVLGQVDGALALYGASEICVDAMENGMIDVYIVEDHQNAQPWATEVEYLACCNLELLAAELEARGVDYSWREED